MTQVDTARTPTVDPYPVEELELDLRWWAAANYLTVGQIYLQDDALLDRPLTHADVKPRLLGHWGTSP
ncbi:MAG: xpkA, partial [Modestobacter sp.]|nr:xpkA [Modestobacter sp.]